MPTFSPTILVYSDNLQKEKYPQTSPFDNLTGKWNFTSNFGQFKENGKEIANIGDIVTLKVKLTNYKGTNQLNAILMEIEKAPISSIKLNSTKTSLKIGESAVLSVDTEPSGGDVSEVKYEIVSGDYC